jgi:hypothetical protein
MFWQIFGKFFVFLIFFVRLMVFPFDYAQGTQGAIVAVPVAERSRSICSYGGFSSAGLGGSPGGGGMVKTGEAWLNLGTR